MTKIRSSVAALTAVALLAGTSLAVAQPEHHHPGPADHHHGPPPPMHPGVRAANPHTAALAHRAEEQHKWGEAERRRADAWRDAYLRQQAATRAHRRAEEIARARAQWAHDAWVWNHAEVKTEMELDSWRLARIEALRALAEKEARLDLIARLDQLRAEEAARHLRRMEYYRSRWGH
jgi:hypothetical protein